MMVLSESNPLIIELINNISNDIKIIDEYKNYFENEQLNKFEAAFEALKSLKAIIRRLINQYIRYPRREYKYIFRDEDLDYIWEKLCKELDNIFYFLDDLNRKKYSSAKVYRKLINLIVEYEEIIEYLKHLDDPQYSYDVKIKPAKIRTKSQIKKPISRSSVGTKMRIRNKVFISYNHKDKKWLERLRIHLKPMERQGTLRIWDDTLIEPGSNWREEIRKAIDTTIVAVLLISADFLASEFITKNELPPLLEAAEKDGAKILPFVISPCLFEETISISQFQSINSPDKPLIMNDKGEQEKMLVTLVKAIEKTYQTY